MKVANLGTNVLMKCYWILVAWLLGKNNNM